MRNEEAEEICREGIRQQIVSAMSRNLRQEEEGSDEQVLLSFGVKEQCKRSIVIAFLWQP